MSSSGVTVSPDCKEKFDEFRLKKGDIGRFLIMKLNESMTAIEVEYTSKSGDTFADFRARMEEAKSNEEGRYAFYDVLAAGKDEKSSEKGDILFIYYCDDSCKIKQKMMYASSKQALKSACPVTKKEVQINDISDLTLEELQAKIKKD